jgi:hypothetical protein
MQPPLQILPLLAVPTRQSLVDRRLHCHSRASPADVGPGARLGWRSMLKLSNGVGIALVKQNNPPPNHGTQQPKSGSYSGTSGRQGGGDYSLPRPVSFQCPTSSRPPRVSGPMDPAAAWSGLLCRAPPWSVHRALTLQVRREQPISVVNADLERIPDRAGVRRPRVESKRLITLRQQACGWRLRWLAKVETCA